MTTRAEINPVTAIELKAGGLSWRQVAAALTEMYGRKVPLQAQSVAQAVSAFKRKRQ